MSVLAVLLTKVRVGVGSGRCCTAHPVGGQCGFQCHRGLGFGFLSFSGSPAPELRSSRTGGASESHCLALFPDILLLLSSPALSFYFWVQCLLKHLLT